jgi:hypothetical protein
MTDDSVLKSLKGPLLKSRTSMEIWDHLGRCLWMGEIPPKEFL